jgi:hypothetical protein
MSMTFIQHVELPSNQTQIDFNSIPTTFTDLVVKLSLRFSDAITFDDVNWTINGSSSGYSARTLSGSGSGVNSYTESGSSFQFTIGAIGTSLTSNTFGNAEIYIPNYRASTSKSVSIDMIWENNATLGVQKITAGVWSNNDPITSLSFTKAGRTFVQGSSATLYGITRGSNGGVTVS